MYLAHLFALVPSMFAVLINTIFIKYGLGPASIIVFMALVVTVTGIGSVIDMMRALSEVDNIIDR